MKYSGLAKHRNLFICLALLAQRHAASATTVPVSPGTGVNTMNSTDTKIVFASPVSNADELLSISSGTVTGYEYESFSVELDFATGSPETIANYTFPGGVYPGIYNLSSISNAAITLPNPSDTVTGLEIVSANMYSPVNVNVSSSAVFTFDTTTQATSAVPEPASLTLLGTSLLAVPGMISARRKRRSN